MVGSPKKPPRVRRKPEDLRTQAIAAARTIIVTRGVADLSLQSVADAIGVTRPNLNHHFGTLAGLHAAIANALVRDLLSAVTRLTSTIQNDGSQISMIVDLAFDAFERDGLASLLNWIKESEALEIGEALRPALLDHQATMKMEGEGSRLGFEGTAMLLAMIAFAESQIGPLLAVAFPTAAPNARSLATEMLLALQRD